MDLEHSRITTVSGKQFYLAKPTADSMVMADVIYALSRICRYGGHIHPRYADDIYTVLQHSVYVYRILRKAYPHLTRAFLWALMHDATEAWYGDIVSPLKAMFPEYSALEDRAAVVAREAFDIPYDDVIASAVHWADKICLRIECVHVSANPECLLKGEPESPFTMLDVDPDFFVWSPTYARQKFREALAEIRTMYAENK